MRLILLLLMFCMPAFGAECTLYEQSHPLYILSGAHLSTGKCTTCGSCHINRIFNGTPRNCIDCHNGDPARNTVYRSASHIPTGTMDCASCHSTVAFTPSTFSHTKVTTMLCKTCHNGSYTGAGALGEPIKHIPEATQLLGGSTLDCKACHTSTTVWTTVTMNHNGTVGSGAGWCKGCHLSGQTWLGHGELMSLTHFQRNPVPLDCSQVGCHRPLGNRGTMYRNWDN